MGYNGWHNYETWVINLHIGNDTEWLEEMAEQSDYDEQVFAEYLETYAWDYIEDVHGKLDGFVSDFVMSGLRQVNWRELAGHYLTDMDIPEPEEEKQS